MSDEYDADFGSSEAEGCGCVYDFIIDDDDAGVSGECVCYRWKLGLHGNLMRLTRVPRRWLSQL